MNNDLISRSAMKTAILEHMQKVGKEDEVYQLAHKHILDILAAQPTAYDVKTVYEFCDGYWKNRHTFEKNAILLEMFINIVKGGGVNE